MVRREVMDECFFFLLPKRRVVLSVQPRAPNPPMEVDRFTGGTVVGGPLLACGKFSAEERAYWEANPTLYPVVAIRMPNVLCNCVGSQCTGAECACRRTGMDCDEKCGCSQWCDNKG